jgi:hypothetical protein
MKRYSWDPARWVFAALSAMAIIATGGPAFAQAPPPIDLPQPVSFLQDPQQPPPPVKPGLPCVQPGGPCVEPGGPCVQPPGAACDAPGCGLFGSKVNEPWTLTGAIWEKDPPLTIGGHFQFGYHNRSTGVFNTHPHHLDLQQGWVYVEKVADGSKGLGIGGRMDVLYGTDAQNTQSFGNNRGRFDFQDSFDHGVYGWAIPQLYGEVAWDKLSVKAGHFFTPAGYEVVAATGNFFYSHSLTHNFSEPFTHTGFLATYKPTAKWTIYGGWTLGWDTGFDRFDDGSNFIGGAGYAITDKMTATYIMTVGDLGVIGEGNSHHFVFDWKFADKWQYVLTSDILHTNEPVFTGNGFDTVGLNNYLLYTINDCWKVGGRGEWWKADGISYHVISGGVNWKPMANLTIRPELRYQWSPAGDGDAGNPVGLPLKGAMFGIDAYITY